MNTERSVLQSAAMRAGAAGSRFRLVSEPARGRAHGSVVLAHAFAEEMNKSRRMAARMARLLAAHGWRVVQADLYGCGDSSGEFRDASWPGWIADLEAELADVAREGPAWLWCIRAGALLAPQLLERRPGLNLLLWQPVQSGALHLQQFLRLHTAARIVGGAAGSSAPLAMLRADRLVELGGYELSPALALGLQQARFDLPAEFAGRVAWFELSTQDGATPSMQTTQAIARFGERGIDVEFELLRGPPFWQTQEIEECELLLERSLDALAGDGPGRLLDRREDADHAA